jgi:hypothetical protein
MGCAKAFRGPDFIPERVRGLRFSHVAALLARMLLARMLLTRMLLARMPLALTFLLIAYCCFLRLSLAEIFLWTPGSGFRRGFHVCQDLRIRGGRVTLISNTLVRGYC